VTDGSQPEPAFRFKYFQQLEGYLELPEQFQPSQLLVSLEVKGQNKLLSRSFDWKALTATGEMTAVEAAPANEVEVEKELPQAVPD
jgi:hypothetical protein